MKKDFIAGTEVIGTRVVGISHDRKTGAVAATYRQVGSTCPLSCAMLRKPDGSKGPCYALKGNVAIHQRRTGADYRDDLDKARGMDLLRHLISGDWFRTWGNGRRLDMDLIETVIAWHKRNPRTLGWGYTHDFRAWDRAGMGPKSRTWPKNFVLLASCTTPEDREAANAAGWQTARVIEETDERGEGETLCPYDAAKHAQKGGEKSTPAINCRNCRKCWEPDGQGLQRDIAFLKM
jgi:hypothetical protein